MTIFGRLLRKVFRLLSSPLRLLPTFLSAKIGAGIGGRFGHVRSPVWRGALIGLIVATICWCLSGTSLIRALENWELDGCFVLRGKRASTANIVIVAVDSTSLQEKPLMFLSPELAKVVGYLHEQGAAAIGVDIVVPANEKTMEYLQHGGPGDAEPMGQAVGQSGNVVLPEWLLPGGEPLHPPFEWTAPSDMPWADLGFVDLTLDRDSCLRRQTLRMWDDQGNVHASMALALLVKASRRPEQWLKRKELSLDGVDVPLGADDILPINYVGPAGSVRTVPFREVLATANPPSQEPGKPPLHATYQGAIVLIGTVAGEFKDSCSTPYTNRSILQWVRSDPSKLAEMMSGTECHANVLATLLDRAFITTPWWLSTPWLLLVVGGAMGALLARCSLEAGAILTLGHHLAWRGLAVGAFCLANWRIEMVPMLLLGVVLYGTIFALRWRWIRRMMGMVKSEAVARAMETGSVRLDLRGEQRAITVLFCDIRNFTPFSERRSAHEVVRLLNAFFAAAVPAIEAEGGIVNQYIGDALMVLFGAPQAQHDQAVRAVRTAEEIVRRVHKLHDRWKDLGAEGFRIGIGIHTGEAVVGMIGSPRRLDYTAIGDTVNTAARIESASKDLQCEIVISQATFSALPEDQQQRISAMGESKTLSVKGKQQTLRVYAVRTCDSPET